MNKPEVVTIGLGYIGLPTSALIASHGTKVLGVDINEKVVDIINRGKIHIVEPNLNKIVSTAVKKGYLTAATKAKEAKPIIIKLFNDFIIIMILFLLLTIFLESESKKIIMDYLLELINHLIKEKHRLGAIQCNQ